MVTISLPVNSIGEIFVTIGERLCEERNRLGYNQPDFAALAETTKKTQIDYEKGVTSPNGNYLSAVSAAGADVQYIITGVRSTQALSSDEQDLIAAFRAAPLAVKGAVIGALSAGSKPTPAAPTKKLKQIVHGSVGQQVSGDVINQKGMSIHVGEGDKPKGGRKR